ncbi:MAG: hypothetical protein ACYCU0_03585 [Solirubrobacteraceae bacterium]
MPVEKGCVASAHLAHAASDVRVEIVAEDGLDDREDFLDERVAARHPLIIGASAVRVRPIEARAWKSSVKPAKERLVSGVHSQRYLGVASVAAEMALSDQYPRNDATVQPRQLRRGGGGAEIDAIRGAACVV